MDPVTATIVGGSLCMALLSATARYRISNPDQYLIKTGLGIRDIWVGKQGLQWPFQTYKYISMHPRNYAFDLHAMSSEKIDFRLPAVFTIGPQNNTDALKKYALVLENIEQTTDVDTVQSIILGILEGETRTLSSQMTMEEIFNNRQLFKEKIIKKVQEELDQLGLYIYNANIKELEDSANSKYFHNTRQKKLSEAENQAKIYVSEANKEGDVGQKEREAVTRQRIIGLEANTVDIENKGQQAIALSTASLEMVKADAFRQQEIARIEATNAAASRQADLERDVEAKRISTETERYRAVDLSKALVLAEIAIKNAEGKAAAIKIEADANLYAEQKKADAYVYTKAAEATSIKQLRPSFDNDVGALLNYLMIQENIYTKLAHTNADAIKGLKPTITIWNTDKTTADPIADVFRWNRLH